MSKQINYRTECTGEALNTVNAHKEAKPDQYGEALTLYGSNFCPFVQRVWIALERLGGIEYRYVEIDPYKKPKELLDVNPKGLVPALKIGQDGKCLGESTVILDYLEDRYGSAKEKKSYLQPKEDAYLRARQRLAADHVNRKVLPAFYRYLQAQEPKEQVQLGQEFVEELKAFEKSMLPAKNGGFWDGSDEIGFVDIQIAPWILRAYNVLGHYRGLQLDKIFDESSRFGQFKKALYDDPSFKATTSTDDLYVDSYARYAENRPGTSQVADAINSGREYLFEFVSDYYVNLFFPTLFRRSSIKSIQIIIQLVYTITHICHRPH